MFHNDESDKTWRSMPRLGQHAPAMVEINSGREKKPRPPAVDQAQPVWSPLDPRSLHIRQRSQALTRQHGQGLEPAGAHEFRNARRPLHGKAKTACYEVVDCTVLVGNVKGFDSQSAGQTLALKVRRASFALRGKRHCLVNIIHQSSQLVAWRI